MKKQNRRAGCAASLRQSRRPGQELAHRGFGAHRGAGEQDDLGAGTRWRASIPVTGRTALYAVSGSSFGIEGMPEDEALDLLDELKRHATQEKYQLRLKYGVGDVVMWDNASLLHSATLTDPGGPAYTLAHHHQGGGEIMRRILFAALAAMAIAVVRADRDARRFAVQRRPRLHQGAGAVPGAGRQVLRQEDQLRAAQEQRARPGEAVLRVHGAGQGGRLRHRLAGAHVDLLQGGAVHRRAVPVPRPRPLEQGARRRPAQAGRRRDQRRRPT